MRALVFFLFLFPGFASSQSGSGNISGTVHDSSNGELVPFVKVTLTDSLGGVKQVAQTDFDGFFKMEKIPDGHYKLMTFVTGYFNDTFEVHKNAEKLQLKIVLVPRPILEEVSIETGGPGLETHHGTITRTDTVKKLSDDEVRGLEGKIIIPPKETITEKDMVEKLSKRDRRKLERIRRRSKAVPDEFKK